MNFFKLCLLVSSVAKNDEKDQVYVPNYKHIPYLRCVVCDALSKQIKKAVKRLHKYFPEVQLESIDFLDNKYITITDNICDVYTHEGRWLNRHAIVVEGEKVFLKNMNDYGVCRSACMTIGRTCQEILNLNDMEVVGLIHQNKFDEIKTLLCDKECSDTQSSPLPKSLGKETFEKITLTEYKANVFDHYYDDIQYEKFEGRYKQYSKTVSTEKIRDAISQQSKINKDFEEGPESIQTPTSHEPLNQGQKQDTNESTLSLWTQFKSSLRNVYRIITSLIPPIYF